jgi:ABC-type bacteriocin/lantibiotic exporter with double-glycine peptidase domain
VVRARSACVLLVVAGTALSACRAGRGRVVSPSEIDAADGWELVSGVPFVEQHSRHDCGPAALAMVLRYWGVTVGVEEVVAGGRPASAAERGMRAGELRDYARARGLDAFVVKGEPGDLRAQIDRRRPLIVGLAQSEPGGTIVGHYEVVIGFNHRRRLILTIDPAAGWRESSFEAFAVEWSGAEQLALVVFRRSS